VTAPAQAQTAPAALTWSSCSTTVKDWSKYHGDETRLECALLSVPLDYSKPDGRKIQLAVSRLKATDPAQRKGVLMVNSGGPGLSSLDAPLSYADTGLGALNTDHDFVGFDPRGTGYGDTVICDPADPTSPPPTATAKEKAKFGFDRETAYNKRCLAMDPAFTQQLTTANVARDMDSLRAAMGERKIDFYGASWGTGLGANYRSLFDSHVAGMWLESVMPPTMDLESMDDAVEAVGQKSFDGLTAWLAQRDFDFHFGTTAAAVAKALYDLRDQLTRNPRVTGSGASQVVVDGSTVSNYFGEPAGNWATAGRELAGIRDGGAPAGASPATAHSSVFGFDQDFPGANQLQFRAVMCNDGTGGRDFDKMWADTQDRARKYPATGGHSINDNQCGSWPAAQPWQLNKGTSPLAMSGHTDEDTTPYAWAVAMHAQIGGTLITVHDAHHGSIKDRPCVSMVVDFLRTGVAPSGSC
jgi:pimeloyl-ACP methyl ester carboxylesterase